MIFLKFLIFSTIIKFVKMILNVFASMIMIIYAFVNGIIIVLTVSYITFKLITVENVSRMEYVSKMTIIFFVSVHNVIKVIYVN